MPEKYWHELVWGLSVDDTTARTSSIASIENGIWRIRCDSQHAWQALQKPDAVFEKIAFLAQVRPVQPLKRLELLMGKIHE